MSYIKIHKVSDTHGYAVEKMQKEFRIVYGEFVKRDGQEEFVKIATSYSNGRMYSFPSPFLADHAIKTEIMPLYKKAGSA